MDAQQVHDYLLNKPEASVGQPFGEGVDVYKVKGKMFATLARGKYPAGEAVFWWLNLKCDPDEAFMLRDLFPAIRPGYHMDKRLWNTVVLDGSVPAGEIQRMIDNSFLLVVQKMPKREQTSLLLKLSAS
ncbi:MmcQ/YjbR family DNA-binding protein [Pseudoalteromonas fenneropenaei]|uniref:MmcQ/YjbR family DNA-binding protein n=1 Tax=Pseudoalteromonas fenneropenaei TaxID=1737459 RepID=A0ABV7CDL3_9GAMM